MTLVNELNRRMLLSTLKFAEVKNAILIIEGKIWIY